MRSLLVLLLALGGCGYLVPHHHQTTELSALPKRAYRLDPEHATILFKVDHLGFSRLVGRFDRFDATLDFVPQDPQAAKLIADRRRQHRSRPAGPSTRSCAAPAGSTSSAIPRRASRAATS